MHGSQYESFRRNFARAKRTRSPEEAAGLLCEMLAQTLNDMYNEARRPFLIHHVTRMPCSCPLTAVQTCSHPYCGISIFEIRILFGAVPMWALYDDSSSS